MAEGFNFSISIPIEADLSKFNQQVKDGVAQAGQQTATVGVNRAPMNPAEQAAVNNAMSAARGVGPGAPRPAVYTPAGTYSLPGGYSPQAGFVPPNPLDLAGHQRDSFRNAFADQWRVASPKDRESALTELERNSSRVDRNADLAALAAQKQEERSLAKQRRDEERMAQRSQQQVQRQRDRFYGMPASGVRGVLGLFGAAESLGAIADIAQLESQGSRGDLARVQADRQIINRIGGGFFGQMAQGGLTIADMALRGFGASGGLGRYSPIAYQEAASRAEQGLAAVQAGTGRLDSSRGIQSEIAKATDAASQFAVRDSYSRSMIAIDSRQRQFSSDLFNESRSVYDRILAETDNGKRDTLIGEYSLLERNRPARESAQAALAQAEQTELTRQSQRRYRQTARRSGSLRSAAEGLIGEAGERSFEAGLLDAEDDAFEDSEDQGRLQRGLNSLSREARRVGIQSDIQTRRSRSRSGSSRLNRRYVDAANIEREDSRRRDLEGARTNEERDAINQEYDTARELSSQDREDEQRIIGMDQNSRLRVGALRAEGQRRGAAVRSIIDGATINAEQYRQRGQGFEDETERELEIGRVGLKAFRKDFVSGFRASGIEGPSRTYLGGDMGQENPAQILKNIDRGIEEMTDAIRNIGKAR